MSQLERASVARRRMAQATTQSAAVLDVKHCSASGACIWRHDRTCFKAEKQKFTHKTVNHRNLCVADRHDGAVHSNCFTASPASTVSDSIVASISACHADDPGSIPGRRAFLHSFLSLGRRSRCARYPRCARCVPLCAAVCRCVPLCGCVPAVPAVPACCCCPVHHDAALVREKPLATEHPLPVLLRVHFLDCSCVQHLQCAKQMVLRSRSANPAKQKSSPTGN